MRGRLDPGPLRPQAGHTVRRSAAARSCPAEIYPRCRRQDRPPPRQRPMRRSAAPTPGSPVRIEAAIPETCPAEIDDPAHFAHILARARSAMAATRRPARAAARPLIETADPDQGLRRECACAAPRIPSPNAVPPISTVRRTVLEFQPRWTRKSTSHPPIAKSANVATSHGTLVYTNECSRSICSANER